MVLKMMNSNEPNQLCCKSENLTELCSKFHHTIELIGKRWNGIIIYHLLNGPLRYHELLDKIHGISDRLLTERLRELEKEGLIIKIVDPLTPRKVQYQLSQSGQQLESVMKAIVEWIYQQPKS